MTGAISSAHWRIELARVARLRYVVLAALAVACAVVSGGRGDWDVFVSAGRSLLGSEGLSVYTLRPDVQTGPVSLVLARVLAITPRNGFLACVVACAVLGLAAIRCLEKAPNTAQTTTQAIKPLRGVIASTRASTRETGPVCTSGRKV